jgi:LmbE family N-acetylglucosaminyl deacetylase
MKNIVAIFAHPDDAEIWAGGTLKKHIDLGDRVKSYIFYEVNEIRKLESEKAQSLLGLDAEFFVTLPYQKPNFEEFIKKFEDVPDIILTHWENDTHIEHQQIFKLSLLLAHYFKRYYKKTPCLLMASTYANQGANSFFNPTIIIDIANQMDIKIEAILCHKSQKPDTILNDIESQNRILGNQIKTKFAEGFIEYPLFGVKRSALRNSFRDLLN